MKTKEEVINRILALEWEMFQTVPTSGRYICQEQPDNFRLHRSAQFMPWREATLQSYLDDLIQAKAQSRNLMTIKYGRMDQLLPAENFSPLIDSILSVMLEWQQQMVDKYPNLMQRARPVNSRMDSQKAVSMETYLRAELETYSERTLELLFKDIEHYQSVGESISETTYQYLARQSGFPSLEALENKIRESRRTPGS